MSDAGWGVLIIDDRPENRAEMRRLLLAGSGRRLRFMEAETGAAGIHACLEGEDGPPDCVLLDYHLPDCEATEVLAALGGGKQPCCPVVVVADGDSARIDGPALLRGGAQDFIGKSRMNPETLTRAVEYAVERFTMTRQARRESEEKLRLSIEHAPVALAMFDREMRYLAASERWSADRGLGERELRGLCHYDLFPHLSEEWKEAHRRALAGEVVRVEKDHYNRSDGSVRWLRLEARPWYDARGAVGGIVVFGEDITERIEAEQALRLMNDRFQAALKSSSILVFSQDAELRYTWINKGILGFTPEEIIGKREIDVFERPEDAAAIEAIKREVLASGRAVRREVSIRSQGVDLFYDLLVEPQHDADGRVAGITCAAVDVTERKRIELNAHFLNRLTMDLALLAEEDEILSTAARRIGEYFGALRCIISDVDYPAGSFIVRHDWHRDAPSMASAYNLSDFATPELLATLAAGGSVSVNDVLADPRTAAHRTIFEPLGVRAWLSAPFHGERGWQGGITVQTSVPRAWRRDEVQLLRGMVARIWPMAQRARALAALRASEERYRGLVEQNVDGIFVCDARGRFLDVNSTGAAMLGYSRDEILGLGIGEVIAAEEVSRIAQEGVRFGGGAASRSEWRFRRKDGSFFQGEVMGRQLPDGRMQAIMRDITERKKIEEKLVEQAERLRAADRRKDEFLAMLAHELRNPLAPLQNAVHLLRRAGSNETTLAWCRDVIGRQIEQLSRLVDDLLDVSRITRGKIELKREPLEVAAIVQRAVETSRPLIDARRHILSVELPHKPLRVNGDLVRLAQVVSNLLNNAAKYTDEAGHIRLNVEQAGDDVVIRVRDTGRGIDPVTMPDLFDLFYQGDRTLDRSDGGLGIGLSLVKRLVEMQGGHVCVYSGGRGKGSEFIVHLPCLTSPPAADPIDSATPTPVHGRLRVLIVDDNRDAAESLGMLLGIEGHHVLTAYDGKAAVDLALTERPAAVLMDIGLPGLNGYEACRRMRDAGLTDALIVAMTGYGQEEDRRLSEAAGFDGHLVKPVELGVIQEWLARV